MDILAKFAAVEVKADSRISEADKHFCEIHQAAYDSARCSFQELEYFWDDIVAEQIRLFTDLTETSAYRTNLRMERGDISSELIQNHTFELHSKFINNLTDYFNNQYHVRVSAHRITEQLVPQSEHINRYDYDKETLKQYQEAMRALSLRYESVIDQIFVQLNGRGLSEQALYELKEKCHTAAWNSYNKKADYEVKNNIIRINHGCHFSNWASRGSWELHKGMKDILYGIAHFETNVFSIYPEGFSDLLGYGSLDCHSNIIKFPTCSKFIQFKMYKNQRVDVKFTSSLYAKQFVTDYLGLTAEEVPS